MKCNCYVATDMNIIKLVLFIRWPGKFYQSLTVTLLPDGVRKQEISMIAGWRQRLEISLRLPDGRKQKFQCYCRMADNADSFGQTAGWRMMLSPSSDCQLQVRPDVIVTTHIHRQSAGELIKCCHLLLGLTVIKSFSFRIQSTQPRGATSRYLTDEWL